MGSILRLHRPPEPTIEITSERALVGREHVCDIVLDDRSVSRKHAILEQRDGAFYVLDQGSANGTFLAGTRVGEARLTEGAELRFGSLKFRVEIEAEVAGTLLMAAPDLAGATMLMSGAELAAAAPPAPASPPPLAPPPVASRPTVSVSSAAPGKPAPPPVPPPQAARPVRPPVAPAAASSQGKAEAAALLGVPPGTSSHEIKQRYDGLAHDLQMRLASAQTPALRNTYQKNLDALTAAFKLLCPEPLATSDDSLLDLPAIQPTVGPDLLDSAVAKRVDPIAFEAAPARPAGGLPQATTFLLIVATAGMALTAFFALKSNKLRTAIAKIEGSPDLVDARSKTTLYQQAEGLLRAGALRNGELRLCNKASIPLEVTWLGAAYLVKGQQDAPQRPGEWDDELGAMADGFTFERFNSAFCRDFKIVLRPGEERTFSFASDADPRCKWDGKGVFWAAKMVNAGGGAPVYASGALVGQTGCAPIGEGL